MLVPEWIYDDSPIEDTFGDGEAAVQWLRRLKHPKNPAAGHAFQLDPWQERVIRKIYGPRHPNGTRVVKRVYLVVPRGNRKTSLAAAIALLHLIGPEREKGNTIVSAGASREQALEAFKEAALIIESDPRLNKYLAVRDYKNTIAFIKERSQYIAISADGRLQHGKTPKVIIADEIHVWEGKDCRDLWGALDSSLVKIPDTLFVVTTTSGRGQDNIAWNEIKKAIDVQKGVIKEPSILPVVFMAEEGDDWKDEGLWNKLNPGMKHGYPVLEAFRDKARVAAYSPSDRDTFLQYNLNFWLDYSRSKFVEMSVFDQGNAEVHLSALEDKPCWLAADLSATNDLTAVVAAWSDGEGGYIVYPWFFCPEENLQKRADQSGQPYVQWAKDGLLIPTPGSAVDLNYVEDHIRWLADKYDVREIAFDPALARRSINNLMEDGLPCVEFRQGYMTMAPAIATLERAIISGKLTHGGHPILRWNFSNIVVDTDPAGNKKFTKAKSLDKIDGAVATVMAVARCAAGDTGRSIYDDVSARPDGLLVF